MAMELNVECWLVALLLLLLLDPTAIVLFVLMGVGRCGVVSGERGRRAAVGRGFGLCWWTKK